MPIKQQKREKSEYDERSMWRIQNKKLSENVNGMNRKPDQDWCES
jgi:hypothetical protein